MEWFEAVILGLLQGLTEFLPVSSSGHLEIVIGVFCFWAGRHMYLNPLGF